jgi:DNA-binding NarL/FixJ family response regulator
MSLRILVVDDHAVVRRGMWSLLESREGCESM